MTKSLAQITGEAAHIQGRLTKLSTIEATLREALIDHARIAVNIMFGDVDHNIPKLAEGAWGRVDEPATLRAAWAVIKLGEVGGLRPDQAKKLVLNLNRKVTDGHEKAVEILLNLGVSEEDAGSMIGPLAYLLA
jgi:hypothetical protein